MLNKEHHLFKLALISILGVVSSCSNNKIILDKNAQQETDAFSNRRKPDENLLNQTNNPKNDVYKVVQSNEKFDIYQHYETINSPVSLDEIKQLKRRPALNMQMLNLAMDQTAVVKKPKPSQPAPEITASSNLSKVINYNKKAKKSSSQSRFKKEAVTFKDSVIKMTDSILNKAEKYIDPKQNNTIPVEKNNVKNKQDNNQNSPNKVIFIPTTTENTTTKTNNVNNIPTSKTANTQTSDKPAVTSEYNKISETLLRSNTLPNNANITKSQVKLSIEQSNSTGATQKVDQAVTKNVTEAIPNAPEKLNTTTVNPIQQKPNNNASSTNNTQPKTSDSSKTVAAPQATTSLNLINKNTNTDKVIDKTATTAKENSTEREVLVPTSSLPATANFNSNEVSFIKKLNYKVIVLVQKVKNKFTEIFSNKD